MSFTCADEAFVSVVFFASDPFGARGIKVECSTSEQSDWIGSNGTTSDVDIESAECSGGLTRMTSSPEDTFEYPANIYLFCYNEDRGYPDGEDVGPYW